jgi:predicted RNase H-like HicB family nuclease
VLVPALPGCLTSGETVAEALFMARDVVPLFLASLRDRGMPIPPDKRRISLDVKATAETLIYRLDFPELEDDLVQWSHKEVAAVA